MSTAQEIENAIRSLSPSEREKLLQHIPQIFPEFAADSEWERIASDEHPRPALTELLNRYEADLSAPRSPEDATYFVAWLDRVIGNASARSDYNSEQEKRDTLDYLNAARTEFQKRSVQ